MSTFKQALLIAALSPLAVQAATVSVFGTSTFNGTVNDHTYSNSLVSVDFDYDGGNRRRSTVEQLKEGVLFDQVTEDGPGRKTTFTFSQIVTGFGGDWDLSYRSNGRFRTGDAEGLALRAYLGDRRVFSGWLLVGEGDGHDGGHSRDHDEGDDGDRGDLHHRFVHLVDPRTEKTSYGFSGFSFNRVVISGYDDSTEAYTLSNLTVTTAVPEPRAYALFLAGLGAIGFIGRRRKGD